MLTSFVVNTCFENTFTAFSRVYRPIDDQMSDETQAVANLLQAAVGVSGEPLVTVDTVAKLIVNGYKTLDLLLCLDLDKDLPLIDGIDMGQKSALRTVLREYQNSRKKIAECQSMQFKVLPTLTSIASTTPVSRPQFLAVPLKEPLGYPAPRSEPKTTTITVSHSQSPIDRRKSIPLMIPAIKNEPAFDGHSTSSTPIHTMPSTSSLSDDSALSQPSTSAHRPSGKLRRFVFKRRILQIESRDKRNEHRSRPKTCDQAVDTRYVVKPSVKQEAAKSATKESPLKSRLRNRSSDSCRIVQ